MTDARDTVPSGPPDTSPDTRDTIMSMLSDMRHEMQLMRAAMQTIASRQLEHEELRGEVFRLAEQVARIARHQGNGATP